jgi:uncharacterized membrane protein
MIIVWGIGLSLVRFLVLEVQGLKGEKTLNKANRLRCRLGTYLLLGLEFIVAADIIHTFLNPTREELTILAILVAIRTVISFFLNREMRHIHAIPTE